METDNFHTGRQKKQTASSTFECSSALCYQTVGSLQSSGHGFHLVRDHALYVHTVSTD